MSVYYLPTEDISKVKDSSSSRCLENLNKHKKMKTFLKNKVFIFFTSVALKL